MIHWTPFQPVPNADAIAEAIASLPSHWSLTPLWEKRPYRDGWQTEPFIPHQAIAAMLQEGEERLSKRTGKRYRAFCSGYGLRLGDASEGLLAVDIDGTSAEAVLTALAEAPLPETVSWTSGKSGRRQLLYQIPDPYRDSLQSFRRKTITQWKTLTTSAGELLEFRYNQHQSVLPPSFHRETGQYDWLVSPETIAVAIAPTWLCEFLVKQCDPAQAKPKPTVSRIRSFATEESEDHSLGTLLDQAITRLPVEQIYYWSGHQFQEVGDTWRGYCPRHQSQSGTAFTLNPHTGQWYCFGCEIGGGAVQYRHFLQGGNGNPRGQTFRCLVHQLATEAGVDSTPSPRQPHQTYQPTEVIHQPYFDWETPPEGTILAVKSSLGSGKTTWLGNVVSELRTEGWLALGHRNSLLLQSCQRWGFTHLQTEQAFDLINVADAQLALCVDSLHHFSPEAFAGKNLILDEVIAIVTHLLTGETLKQKREEIIQRFSEALQQANRIICLDGMLTDWCVNYLHELAGKERPLVKVENSYQGTPLNVKFLQESWQENGQAKRSDRSPLLQQLWQSQKPVICTDSQLEAEALDHVLAETGKQGLRIDSKTTSEPYIQTFLKSPNHYITTYGPDYLIYTPAAEAGIDISIDGYFSDQFCLFFGVVQTNAQVQMMSRVRDPNLTRWLWCSRYGQVNQMPSHFQFRESLTQAIHALILKTGTTLLEGKDTTAVVEQFVQEVTAATEEIHHQTFCILQAISHYEQSQLWDCLYQSLIQAGHQVALITLETCWEAKQQEKRAKEAVKQSNAEAIYQGNTHQGKQAEQMHRLLRKQLPGIEQTACWGPEFIKRVVYDDRDFIAKQERFWLIHHPDLIQQMMPSMAYSGIAPHLMQQMHQQWAIIQGLVTLNLPPLLNLETTWTTYSPDLQQLQQTIKDQSLDSVLKLNPETTSPISLFRQLLRLIGVKLTSHHGHYRINATAWYDRDRLTILACLDRRWLGEYADQTSHLVERELPSAKF